MGAQRNSDMPADAFGRRLAEQTGRMIDAAVEPLKRRIAQLEAEQLKCMRFQGPYQDREEYHVGDCVQRSGTLFVCVQRTMEVPGHSRHWRQLIKTIGKGGY